MMGFYYAQIDGTGKVNGVSESPREIKLDNMILIDSYDESLLRQIYDAKTKTFSPDLTPTDPPAGKTISQQILEEVVSIKAKVEAISAAAEAEIKAG
jgi:hypothetical protein